MSTQFAVAALIRWVSLASLAAVIGGLVLEQAVLPPEPVEFRPTRQRLQCWSRGWVALLGLATLGDLVVHAQTMTQAGLGPTLAALPTVLVRTHFGAIWIARIAGLVLALLLSFPSTTAARRATLFLALGVALTTSLTGHAGDWGDFTASVFADWTHVVASAAWAGGLIGLGLVALRNPATRSPELLGQVARRFSRLAGWCLLTVVLTGSYNVWVELWAPSALWTTPYGRILSVKLLVVLALVWLGALNRWTIVPRFRNDRAARGIGFRLFRVLRFVLRGPTRAARASLPERFARYVGREAILAALIFGCTAVLSESTPARHARHAGHMESGEAEPGPVRVTMEQLHESGGVPKGWQFQVPAGDSRRGRELFARLQCYACHRVGDARFPSPSGAGPDLTAVGVHHPAGYLAESIVNPNAVIVEGPGYTGPDDRSTMPDYRDSLSVNDLIDLVAYLKGL